MVNDEFALNKFKKIYGQMFVNITLAQGPSGGPEIIATYNKPRFKHDWVPNHFCRRPVRCIKLEAEQPATPTPPVAV